MPERISESLMHSNVLKWVRIIPLFGRCEGKTYLQMCKILDWIMRIPKQKTSVLRRDYIRAEDKIEMI